MIPFSLQRVITTGDWSPFRLGMSRAEVVAVCGEPDDVGNPEAVSPGWELLKYGDVEVALFEGSVLYVTIHGFFGEAPQGGARLALDAWIMRRGLTLVDFLTELTERRVAYRLNTPKYDDRQRHVVLHERPACYAVFAEWDERSGTADESRFTLDGLWLSDMGTGH